MGIAGSWSRGLLIIVALSWLVTASACRSGPTGGTTMAAPSGSESPAENDADTTDTERDQAPGFAWPRVQRGFSALEKRYGSTNHQRNIIAFMAVEAGDAATADELFARIGEDWSRSVWKSKARYEAARAGRPQDVVR